MGNSTIHHCHHFLWSELPLNLHSLGAKRPTIEFIDNSLPCQLLFLECCQTSIIFLSLAPKRSLELPIIEVAYSYSMTRRELSITSETWHLLYFSLYLYVCLLLVGSEFLVSKGRKREALWRRELRAIISSLWTNSSGMRIVCTWVQNGVDRLAQRGKIVIRASQPMSRA